MHLKDLFNGSVDLTEKSVDQKLSSGMFNGVFRHKRLRA
jgi:hypothetical protein